MKNEISAEVLRSLLTYDPDSGVLRWKVRPGIKSNVMPGDKAGYIRRTRGTHCFMRIKIHKHEYQVSHVIWCIVTGEWPSYEIDHRDTNSLNNRWLNLREATRHQQMANRRTQSNNTSGYKGVGFNKKTGKWVSRIKVDGRVKFLGHFFTPEDAHEAYKIAAQVLFGEFANDGIISSGGEA